MKFLARKERRDRDLSPGKGAWRPFQYSAVFGCPSCGYVMPLEGKHLILDDGTVVRSVRCPLDYCSFKATVTLEGWDKNRDPDNPSSAFADLAKGTDPKPD